jgi:hypothetical protein
MRYKFILFSIVWLVACARSPEQIAMRLDGSSVESFQRSYATMLEALPGPDKARLAIAMERIATVAVNGKIERTPVDALRIELANKSYAELLQLADKSPRKFKIEFITQPSNREPAQSGDQ